MAVNTWIVTPTKKLNFNCIYFLIIINTHLKSNCSIGYHIAQCKKNGMQHFWNLLDIYLCGFYVIVYSRLKWRNTWAKHIGTSRNNVLIAYNAY